MEDRKQPKDIQLPLRITYNMDRLLEEVARGLRKSKQDIVRDILEGELLLIQKEAKRLGNGKPDYGKIPHGWFEEESASNT